MQTTDKGNAFARSQKCVSAPTAGARSLIGRMTKATPSHESNRVSRSQSGARFQLLSAKVIIFFIKTIYIVIFLHIFAFHFRHNIKIRSPSIIFGKFLLIA